MSEEAYFSLGCSRTGERLAVFFNSGAFDWREYYARHLRADPGVLVFEDEAAALASIHAIRNGLEPIRSIYEAQADGQKLRVCLTTYQYPRRWTAVHLEDEPEPEPPPELRRMHQEAVAAGWIVEDWSLFDRLVEEAQSEEESGRDNAPEC